MSEQGEKKILVINGGGGSEHSISLVSSAYMEKCLKADSRFNVLEMTIHADGTRTNRRGELVELRRAGELYNHSTEKTTTIDFFVPCIHGPPGETGEIQAVFELMGKPYLGVGPEGNMICFNKVTTKLWLDALGIPTTPWIFLNSAEQSELERAREFFNIHRDVFVKAASQGSSIGCYHITEASKLDDAVIDAFKYSPYILIEQTLKARELEMSFFEHEGKLQWAGPGEIICPNGFYTYEEKYSNDSKTVVSATAEVDSKTLSLMQEYGRRAFIGFKLRHISRIDFFVPEPGVVLINEINTFPGMTPISLFPKMIETTGLSFQRFLCELVARELNLPNL
jgi:D-alanine-D-alanine ligase